MKNVILYFRFILNPLLNVICIMNYGSYIYASFVL